VTVAFPVCLHYFLNQLRISLGPIYRHLGSSPNHLKKLQPRFHELHYLDHPGRRDPMVASVGSSVAGFLLFGILDEGFVLTALSGRPSGWAPSVSEGRDHRVQGAATVTVLRLVRGGWTMSPMTPWEMLEKKRSKKYQDFCAQAPSEAKARPHK
jgi:hypothetical protein